MTEVVDTTEGLENELVCLCEVQGELDPETNATIDARIKKIREQLEQLTAK